MIKKLTWLWISVLLVCVVVIFFICWWWFRSAQNVSEFQPPERNSTILQNSSSPTHLVTTVLLVRHAEKAIPTVIDEEFRTGRIKKHLTVEDMVDRSFISALGGK